MKLFQSEAFKDAVKKTQVEFNCDETTAKIKIAEQLLIDKSANYALVYPIKHVDPYDCQEHITICENEVVRVFARWANDLTDSARICGMRQVIARLLIQHWVEFASALKANGDCVEASDCFKEIFAVAMMAVNECMSNFDKPVAADSSKRQVVTDSSNILSINRGKLVPH